MKQTLYTSEAGVSRFNRGLSFFASTKENEIYTVEFTVSERFILDDLSVELVEIYIDSDADL